MLSGEINRIPTRWRVSHRSGCPWNYDRQQTTVQVRLLGNRPFSGVKPLRPYGISTIKSSSSPLARRTFKSIDSPGWCPSAISYRDVLSSSEMNRSILSFTRQNSKLAGISTQPALMNISYRKKRRLISVGYLESWRMKITWTSMWLIFATPDYPNDLYFQDA